MAVVCKWWQGLPCVHLAFIGNSKGKALLFVYTMTFSVLSGFLGLDMMYATKRCCAGALGTTTSSSELSYECDRP